MPGRKRRVDDAPRLVTVAELREMVRPPFSTTFTRSPAFESILDSMREDGPLAAFPVLVANIEGKPPPAVVDGHARIRAATEAGVKELWAAYMDMPTERIALSWRIWLHTARRNLSDIELQGCSNILSNL